MRFEYTISLEDYKVALALHSRQSLSARIAHLCLFWLPTMIGTFVGLLIMHFGFHLRYMSVFPWLSVLFWVGFVCIAAPIQYGSYTRRVFDKRNPVRDRANWTDINDQGVISAIVGTEEGVFSWKDIAGFAQNEKITLLFLDKKRFLFFPTSALDQSQRAELKDLVARHLVREQC